MPFILEKLLKRAAPGDTKSYLVGLERGRLWASEDADYFDMKEWADLSLKEMDAILPKNEELHFRILQHDGELEWGAYVRGWVEGVKEIASRY